MNTPLTETTLHSTDNNTQIKAFFDADTFTLTYVVFDAHSKDAFVIDPVLDFNPVGAKIETTAYQTVKDFILAHDLNVHYVLETHAHADHLSSSQLFKQDFPNAKVAISEKIKSIQSVFKGVFNDDSIKEDGSQFDHLITENEVLMAGSLEIKSLNTPGHTPACLSFVVDDVVFTGDALFMPDFGTGRCDFPEGSSSDLYHSVHEVLYQLNDSMQVFVGHDYQPNGRNLEYITSIGESKKHNKQLMESTSEAQFIEFRNNRDAELNAPKLLFQSIQVNIEAGHLPRAEANGTQYLKTPLTVVK
jgi:glyoxylase-like metal-dependent hydrolase (beta-lactamase superfamily II)